MIIVGFALKSSGHSTFASTASPVIGASVVFAAVVTAQIVEVIIEKNVQGKLQEGYDVDRLGEVERHHSWSLRWNLFMHLLFRLAIFCLSLVLILEATDHRIIKLPFKKLVLHGENILIASAIIGLYLLQLINSYCRAGKKETTKIVPL